MGHHESHIYTFDDVDYDCNQPVFISADIEDRAVTHEIRMRERGSYVVETSPLRFGSDFIPVLQGGCRIRVCLRKFLQRLVTNYMQPLSSHFARSYVKLITLFETEK